MSEQNQINHLRSLLNKGRLLPVVGTGISYLSTGGSPISTWSGFVSNGINFVVDNVADLPQNLVDSIASLDNPTAETLIKLADEIESRLGGAKSDDFRRWLHGSIGMLRPSYPNVLKDIGKLGRVVATTNYDSLIEQTIGGPPVTWLDRSKLHQVIAGDDYGVIHLHGYWEYPDSMIFSSTSYDRITGDEFSQTMLRSLVVMHSLVFIGFGSGLNDPNFSRLRSWMRSWARFSPYGHFRLVRSEEISEMTATHPDNERIIPIVYGDNYADLPKFIEDLAKAPRSKAVAAAQNRRWRSLERVVFPLISTSENAVISFLSELGAGLVRHFGRNASGRFNLLFRVETREKNGIVLPVIVTYCHHPEFLTDVRDHAQALVAKLYELKTSGVTGGELDRAKQSLASDAVAPTDGWHKKLSFSLVDTFHCLQLELDHKKKEITIAVQDKMSINPEDYENYVQSTSELFAFLASCFNLTFGITSLDNVVDNPRLIPLLVDVLDHTGIDLHSIRFDADSPEAWIYFNDPFSEEVGGLLKPMES